MTIKWLKIHINFTNTGTTHLIHYKCGAKLMIYAIQLNLLGYVEHVFSMALKIIVKQPIWH